MFTVIQRKPEDIKLENNYKGKIKVLQDEYKEEQSDFDKKLKKYNSQLKKLDNTSNNGEIDELKQNIKKLESELNGVPVENGRVIAPDTNVVPKVKAVKTVKKKE